ncbi:MAG: hypothetical protein L0H64_08595 [Pseudonocardia sp.]|nr:hypothetical protein [Pseudonocardia sp.]
MHVLRLAFSPRWMMWHLLTLGAMATCGWLAIWQWQRAGSALGSALNVGYGLQWPVFAIFFGVMWWRMLRLEARRIPEDPVAQAPPVALPDTSSPFTAHPRVSAVPAITDETNPQLSEYNRLLKQLADRHERSH